jgi:uncharacterized protein YcnI
MIRKLAVVGAIVVGVVALMAGPAFAHVEIERDGEVAADGVVSTTLTVPNEEPKAGTVKVELVFPATPELTSAEPGAVTGWTATVQKSPTGAVQQVTWTGGPLTGSDKVELPLKIGNIPADVDTVDFKALQTYDNSDVVRWIEVTPAGGEEPEHPAPVLTARGKQVADDDEAADAGATSDSHAAATTTKSSSDDGLSTAAIVAIVVGIVVVLLLLAWVLSRSRRDMGSKVD